MNPVRKSILYLLIFLVLPNLLWAWTGKVVGISDGDTITVLYNGKGLKIRLYGIDTPEKRQAFGNKAKQFTSDMVFGKMVEVEPKGIDRYGRIIGLVYVDGNSLNQALVSNGYAWVYRKYCKAELCDDWLNLENAARHEKIGLWAGPTFIPPWEYRHKRRSKRLYHQEAVSLSGLHNNLCKMHKNMCSSFKLHRTSSLTDQT